MIVNLLFDDVMDLCRKGGERDSKPGQSLSNCRQPWIRFRHHLSFADPAVSAWLSDVEAARRSDLADRADKEMSAVHYYLVLSSSDRP